MAVISPLQRKPHVRWPDPQRVVLNIGPALVVFAIVISVLTQVTAATLSIGFWPRFIALIALAVGIPHGAADNLTLSHALTRRQWLHMSGIYLSIAAMAAALIIIAPVIGFVVVIAMTVWHFGTGDVEAIQELQGRPAITGTFRALYALALGSAPVLLPLTSPAALNTVVSLEPRLAPIYSDHVSAITRSVVLTLIVITLLVLINRNDLRGAFELAILALLGLVVSPFIAFAVYFGFWHAARHTARLAQASSGTVTVESLGRVVKIGLPSLIGFIVILIVLVTFFGTASLTGSVLWFALAIVWGLTVPHMWFVSRFDQRRRSEPRFR